ncbi:MAG: aldose 1-epimerase [Victivallaceae bacterium]|nr:aldose 1-epimerase [Victivallaceae bacterium]
MDEFKKITLETSCWLAEFYPCRAGNMTRLCHKKSGTEIVRTPPDLETYLKQPEVWGVPVLFPPNRTPYGKFCFRGREYQMPLNEVSRNNNLHGVIMDLPWQCEITENQAELVLHHRSREIWQHDFSMKLSYDFGVSVVKQTLCVTNESRADMPFFVGFHTALPMPPDRSLRFAHLDWCLSLPKPFLVPDGTKCPSTLPDGFFPGGTTPEDLDELLPMLPDETGFRGVEVDCPMQHARYRYTPGKEWKYWMCWNANGKKDFFCAEPMSGIVDCFHHQEEPDSGFDFLKPGESRVLTAEFSIETDI